ncbi:MAG: hypothetical protein QM477_02900, partial [Planctomycetota bacterium]
VTTTKQPTKTCLEGLKRKLKSDSNWQRLSTHLWVPIEIYVFCAEQRWAHYEAIIGDIFDHLIAVVPEFGLKVYQRPSGGDILSLGAKG